MCEGVNESRQSVASGRANDEVQGPVDSQCEFRELIHVPVDTVGCCCAGGKFESDVSYFGAPRNIVRPTFPIPFGAGVYVQRGRNSIRRNSS